MYQRLQELTEAKNKKQQELANKHKEDESHLTFKPKINKLNKKGEEEDPSAVRKSVKEFMKNSLVANTTK